MIIATFSEIPLRDHISDAGSTQIVEQTRSVFDRYNITNYEDLVDAARKISRGRERIEQEALKFSKDTNIADDRRSFGENRTKAN